MVPPSKRAAKLAEAATLPKALITDIDVNWLQVRGDGALVERLGRSRGSGWLACLAWLACLVGLVG